MALYLSVIGAILAWIELFATGTTGVGPVIAIFIAYIYLIICIHSIQMKLDESAT